MDSCLAASPRLQILEDTLTPLRTQLAAHPVYGAIHTLRHLQIFMEAHVFAVWDFMSLLKALQKSMTCVDVPWAPSRYSTSARFVNQIVLGEESDEYTGRAVSHFEVYLEAMREVGADLHPIQSLIKSVQDGKDWKPFLSLAPPHARAFVLSTFEVIETGTVAAQAAAFTFGREDVIPGMFRRMVRDLNGKVRTETFTWYLERHIEVDGDEHGPLSLSMVEDVCGHSPERWAQATAAAESALKARLALWDGVVADLT